MAGSLEAVRVFLGVGTMTAQQTVLLACLPPVCSTTACKVGMQSLERFMQHGISQLV